MMKTSTVVHVAGETWIVNSAAGTVFCVILLMLVDSGAWVFKSKFVTSTVIRHDDLVSHLAFDKESRYGLDGLSFCY